MFKHFQPSSDLNEIWEFILEDSYEKSRAVIIDYETLINRNSNLRVSNKETKITMDILIEDEHTLEFIILDSTLTLHDKIATLRKEKVLDYIFSLELLNQEISNLDTMVDRVNNIIHVKEKHNYIKFLHQIINHKVYSKTFTRPMKVYVVLSSLGNFIEFLMKYSGSFSREMVLILYSLETYKEKEMSMFYDYVKDAFFNNAKVLPIERRHHNYNEYDDSDNPLIIINQTAPDIKPSMNKRNDVCYDTYLNKRNDVCYDTYPGRYDEKEIDRYNNKHNEDKCDRKDKLITKALKNFMNAPVE